MVLKINGQNVKEWLECSASFFEQIDPEDLEPQMLTNQSQFPAYHFDVIDGIDYKIDITQPARYNAQCQLALCVISCRLSDINFVIDTINHIKMIGGEL